MRIDKFSVFRPTLRLEEGQTAEEIWHLIADNELNGLRVVCDIISPLSMETLNVLYQTTFLKCLSLSIVIEDFELDYDFLYDYTALEKLHLQSYLTGKIDLGLLPKTLHHIRFVWSSEKVSISQPNESIASIEIKVFEDKNCERLSMLKALNNLTLYCDKKCKSLKGLEDIENLKSLGIGASLKSFQTIGELTQLTNLAFDRFSVNNLDELANLKNLQSLAFTSRTITDISAMAGLQNLEAISISGCWKLEDFSAIGALKKLRFLEIEDCKRLKSIDFVAELPNLEQLTLYGTTIVNDHNLTPAEHVERVYIQNILKKYNINLEHKSIVGKKYSIQHYIA